METDQIDSQELPARVRRGATLIRDEVSVRWPAGHVEIALIQLQRRRQQRRFAVAGATLSVVGVGLVAALGFGGYVRDELAARGLIAPLPGAAPGEARGTDSAAPAATPAAKTPPAVAVTSPVVIPLPVP